MNKKIILAGVVAVLAIVLILVAYYSGWLGGNALPSTSTSPTDTKATNVPQVSFMMGEVVKTENSKIYFITGGVEKIAVVGKDTQLVKQQTGAGGVVKVVSATLADFKKSSTIVIYPNPGASVNEFTPTKIQII